MKRLLETLGTCKNLHELNKFLYLPTLQNPATLPSQQFHCRPINELQRRNAKLVNFPQEIHDTPKLPFMKALRNPLCHELHPQRRRKLRGLHTRNYDTLHDHYEILKLPVSGELGGEVGEVAELGSVGVPSDSTGERRKARMDSRRWRRR